ncbi:TPA: helix-turn-helix transcriptional regulator [Stenotrophomonas maltophilia]
MNNVFPLSRDPISVSPPPDKAQWQQEIEEAKSGIRAKVSTKAAAFYLGVHYTTLRAWVRAGEGPEPVKNPSRPGTTAVNQHMGFTLQSLDRFLKSREGSSVTRGKRSEVESVLRDVDRIQATIELKMAEDALAKAREKARRLGVLSFNGIEGIADIHPWLIIEGRIAGHLWVLPEEQLEEIDLDDVIETSLISALALPWESDAHRQPYAEVAQFELNSLIASIERGGAVQRAADEERFLDVNTPKSLGIKGPDRL